MKFKETAIAIAAMTSIGVGATASAQISDDVITIGFLTDTDEEKLVTLRRTRIPVPTTRAWWRQGRRWKPEAAPSERRPGGPR